MNLNEVNTIVKLAGKWRVPDGRLASDVLLEALSPSPSPRKDGTADPNNTIADFAAAESAVIGGIANGSITPQPVDHGPTEQAGQPTSVQVVVNQGQAAKAVQETTGLGGQGATGGEESLAKHTQLLYKIAADLGNPPAFMNILKALDSGKVIRSGDTFIVEPKSFLISTSFWGVVVSFAAVVVQRFGKHMSPALQSDMVQFLATCGEFIGPTLALWGRWHAKQPLTANTSGDAAMKTVTLKSMLLAMLGAMLLLGSGCANTYTRAEHIAWRESYHQGTADMLEEHRLWAAALSAQPGAHTLPNLTPLPQTQRDVWYNARARVATEAEAQYKQDKSHD